MTIHRFSWLLRGVLAVGALGLSSLTLGGCGDDSEPSCDGGVLRDGKCYLSCSDGVSECGGDTARRCVAYTDRATGVLYAEGKCFATCTDSVGCGAGQVCQQNASLKGETVTVCVSRPTLGLVAGNPGDACTDDVGCDEGSGVRCLDGLCARPPVDQGQACSDEQTCIEGLVCFQGSCQTTVAGPGEGCEAARVCDAAQGLACSEGRCFYGCKTLEGCAEGYACAALAAPENGYLGVCRPDTSPDTNAGQYGTACPKGTECTDGFTCVGEKGSTSAFCSKIDGCAQDSECPAGYWCGSRTQLTSDGKQIDFDNPQKLCLKRDFCAPCAADLDCSFTPGSICVPDQDGEKFCSLPCNNLKNSCVIGAACVDTGAGVFACRPDVGVCHPKGAPTGCEPCRIDGDCGERALCRDGAIGNKPSVKWCQPSCGAPDADGKRPCPLAPNGAEMICLDENLFSLGGPIEPDNSSYGLCFRPFTVDNTTVGTKDPANNVCGNGKREGDEECDDGNTTANDGCASCKISANCRFTLGPVVAPGKPATLSQGGKTLTEIPASCPSFRVEGTIAKAGDVAEFRFPLVDGVYDWFEVATGAPGTCTTDLVATVQTGDYDAATDTLDLTDKNGKITACADLDATTKNLDAKEPSLCPGGNFLGCGSCTDKGLCGTCDDDSGIGNCPRLLLSNTTSFQGFPVKFASVKQQARIYARDPNASGVTFVAIADRLASGSQGPKFSPALSCN